MFNRTMRAEARNRAREEIRRVINSREQVRKWEKKWVVVKDTSMKIFKWVPVVSSGSTGKLAARRISPKVPPPPPSLNDSLATEDTTSLDNQDSQQGSLSQQSAEKADTTLNEDSRTGFSDADYDTDSNTGLVHQYDPNNSQTDFSSLQNDDSIDPFVAPSVPGMMEPPLKRFKS